MKFWLALGASESGKQLHLELGKPTQFFLAFFYPLHTREIFSVGPCVVEIFHLLALAQHGQSWGRTVHSPNFCIRGLWFFVEFTVGFCLFVCCLVYLLWGFWFGLGFFVWFGVFLFLFFFPKGQAVWSCRSELSVLFLKVNQTLRL